MIWQNPWAWAGLSALLLPVLIHLFSRRQAAVQPFPTLRFLDASRLLPTRRTRLSDRLLLLVRLGILAAATAALAQPLWLSLARQRARERTLARVIVVDTSASMLRMVPANGGALVKSGGRAIDQARIEADRLAGEATTASIVMTSEPGQALAGAAAWLRLRSGRGEVAIVSDFQTSAIDSLDLLVVPAEFGLKMVPIAVPSASADLSATASTVGDTVLGALIVTEIPSGDQRLRASTTVTAHSTLVEWRFTNAAHDSSTQEMQLLASVDEQARIQRAVRAVKTIGGAVRVSAGRPVSIVFPGFPERTAILEHARPLDSLWMARVVTRVRADRVWMDAADDAEVVGDGNTGAMYTALSRARVGKPVALAMSGVVHDRVGLVITANVDAGSVAAAALIDAVSHAALDAPSVSERDPGIHNASVLRAWERASSMRAPVGVDSADMGESDARWVWVLVLVLIALESWMRRVRRVRRNERQPVVAVDVAN